MTVLGLSHFDNGIILECLLRRKSLKSSGAISPYLPSAVTNTKSVKVVRKLGLPVFLFNWVIIESTESFSATFRECHCPPFVLLVL